MAGDVGTYLTKFGSDNALGFGSSALISLGAAVAICGGPVGWLIGGRMIVGGLIGSYYAAGLNDGWSNDKWIKFGLNVGPALVPFVGAEGGVAGELGVSYLTSTGLKETVATVSADSEENIITQTAVGDGVVLPGGYVTSVQYVKYGTAQSVVRTAYGATKKEATVNLLIGFEYDKASTLVDEYDELKQKYTTTSYNNTNDYINSLSG